MIITIDGPAGSGKSTLSTMLAKHLGFFCLNSGYLYRGVGYILITHYGYDKDKLSSPDSNDVKAIFESGDFKYRYEHGLVKVYFKENITQFLKQVEVSKAAARIAQHDSVRQLIRAYKRQLVEGKDSVAEGRVCGAVVFPDADLKLFVTADPKIRAERMIKEQAYYGTEVSYEQALQLIVKRDHTDMTRAVDPLVQPKDAVVLDTSHLSKEDMLKKVVLLVQERMKK